MELIGQFGLGDLKMYRIKRKEFEELNKHFLTPIGVEEVKVRGEPDLLISISINGQKATLNRKAASEIFRSLARKLLAQEYLSSLKEENIEK